MKMLSTIGALASLGALLAGASPAFAHDGHGRNGDRGGWGRDGGHHGQGDQGYYQDDRRAVEQCTHAARRDAGRYGSARVEVTQVRRERYGFEVKGRVVVLGRDYYRSWNDRGYDRGYGDRDYGRGDGTRGRIDEGKFKCRTDMGRVSELRLWGLGDRGRW